MDDQASGMQIRGVEMGKTRKPSRNTGPHECVCPKCGYVKSQPRGTACSKFKCPTCGSRLEENTR